MWYDGWYDLLWKMKYCWATILLLVTACYDHGNRLMIWWLMWYDVKEMMIWCDRMMMWFVMEDDMIYGWCDMMVDEVDVIEWWKMIWCVVQYSASWILIIAVTACYDHGNRLDVEYFVPFCFYDWIF